MSTKTPDRNLALMSQTLMSQALVSAVPMKKTPRQMMKGRRIQKKGWKTVTTIWGYN